jgi:hypothetical protein
LYKPLYVTAEEAKKMKAAIQKRNEAPMSGREIADHYRVDVHSVRRWRYLGCPAEVYNPKLIRYYLSEVDEWLRNRKIKSGLPTIKTAQANQQAVAQ